MKPWRSRASCPILQDPRPTLRESLPLSPYLVGQQLAPATPEGGEGGDGILLIVVICLTVAVWRKRWKGWALAPVGACLL